MTDEELWGQVRAGASEAFGQLFERLIGWREQGVGTLCAQLLVELGRRDGLRKRAEILVLLHGLGDARRMRRGGRQAERQRQGGRLQETCPAEHDIAPRKGIVG